MLLIKCELLHEIDHLINDLFLNVKSNNLIKKNTTTNKVHVLSIFQAQVSV